MSLAIPTTAAISDEIVAQLEASLSQTIPLLPRAFTRVLAKALGGVIVLLYKYCGFIFLQLFVAYASMEWTTINGKRVRPLVEWGRLIGVGDPDEATQAELVIDITVINQTRTLPGGSQLLRTETGVGYSTVAPVDLDAATVQATIRATSDQDGNGGVGTQGNLNAGDEVSFVNPLPNVSTVATVDSVTVTAADAETETAYRARVVGRFQAKPQGGAYADYRVWGVDVEGIVYVYPYTSALPGQVDVYCEATVASSGNDDGIPTTAQLTAVAAAIELDVSGLATRRPATAAVNVYPIARNAFDVEINGLQTTGAGATLAEVKDTLEDGLDEYLRGREPYIVGLSVLPRLDRITEAGVAGVVDTIVAAEGATMTSISLEIDGVPINAHTLDDGEKAKLGTASYG